MDILSIMMGQLVSAALWVWWTTRKERQHKAEINVYTRRIATLAAQVETQRGTTIHLIDKIARYERKEEARRQRVVIGESPV